MALGEIEVAVQVGLRLSIRRVTGFGAPLLRIVGSRIPASLQVFGLKLQPGCGTRKEDVDEMCSFTKFRARSSTCPSFEVGRLT